MFICDDCEAKTLLKCIHCSRMYEQPSWYYGTHASHNFMCNTCNWQREEPPPVGRDTLHTYLHTLVRCTPKTEDSREQAVMTTDERIGVLERSVGRLDGRMGRVEEALLRIERLLVANLAAPSGSSQPLVCAHCNGTMLDPAPSQ